MKHTHLQGFNAPAIKIQLSNMDKEMPCVTQEGKVHA